MLLSREDLKESKQKVLSIAPQEITVGYNAGKTFYKLLVEVRGNKSATDEVWIPHDEMVSIVNEHFQRGKERDVYTFVSEALGIERTLVKAEALRFTYVIGAPENPEDLKIALIRRLLT